MKTTPVRSVDVNKLFTCPAIGGGLALGATVFLGLMGLAWTSTIAAAFLVVATAIYFAGLKNVEDMHFAVLLRLGVRTEFVLLEGWHWYWPWLYSKEDVNRTEVPIEGTANLITHDQTKLQAKYILQLAPSAEIGDHRGSNRFIQILNPVEKGGLRTFAFSEDAKKLIGSRISQALRVRVGACTGEDLTIYARAINLCVLADLQLDVMPNVDRAVLGDPGVITVYTAPSLRRVDMVDAITGVVKDSEIIPFYHMNADFLEGWLRLHSGTDSRFEENFGVKVVDFTVSETPFSPETQRAMDSLKTTQLFNETVAQFKVAGSADPVGDALAHHGKSDRLPVGEFMRGLIEAIKEWKK